MRTGWGVEQTRVEFGECGCPHVAKREAEFERTSSCGTLTWATLMSPMGGGSIEGVVDGLPLFGGAQLAVDTTLVCALHRDGTPVGRAAETDGVALKAARRRKERRCPELLGRRARAKLVVLAVEVGGRWSEETRTFLSLLVRGKARSENHLLRNRVQQAWRLRWGSLLSCTTACAVASSMLELPGARGADGNTPALHDVEQDFRHVGLAA